MSVIKANEVGKIIDIVTGFDMSGSTVLSIVLIDPTGLETTVTGANVTAPAVADPATTPPLVASEYFQYVTALGDITVEGIWHAYGVYEDATPKKFFSDCVHFTVEPECDTTT